MGGRWCDQFQIGLVCGGSDRVLGICSGSFHFVVLGGIMSAGIGCW